MILFLTWVISSVLLTWYKWIVTNGSTTCGGSKVKEHQNVSRHFSPLFALPNAMAPKRAAELTTTGRRTKVAKMPQLKVLTSSSKAWPWVGDTGLRRWSEKSMELPLVRVDAWKGGREMWIVRMELFDFKCFFLMSRDFASWKTQTFFVPILFWPYAKQRRFMFHTKMQMHNHGQWCCFWHARLNHADDCKHVFYAGML